MELDQVLKRVRQFVAKAEAPIAPGATPAERQAAEIEQKSAREMADALMLKYAVTRAQAEATRPASEHQKPSVIEIALASNSEVSGYVSTMANFVAAHCRCLIRLFNRYDSEERTWMAKVYGFESDVRYFEILYTTLRLHMLGAIIPKPDLSKSLEDNAYTLRSAGFSWREIAGMYGWVEVYPQPGEAKKMFENRNTGKREPLSRSVDIYAAAYKNAVKARGEALNKGPTNPRTFRLSAARGYTSRLYARLREVQSGRLAGADVILRSRMDDLHLFFKQDNPDLFAPAIETDEKPLKGGRPRKFKEAPFSAAGYDAGVRHANTVSLNPAASSKTSKEIS